MLLGKLRILAGALAVALATIGLSGFTTGASASASADRLVVDEFRLSDASMAQLRSSFYDQLEAKYAPGSWAPLRMELGDADLAVMGLPSRAELQAADLSRPVVIPAKGGGGSGGGGGGSPQPAAGPGVVAVAGAGWAGIRPGAWLLLITKDSVGWCSAAHVYGSPGSYQISTAGHCGKVGDKAYMLGAVGGDGSGDVLTGLPVLLPIGTFTKSTGVAGIGKDWALISIASAYQSLVTPTMAFWGGPIGTYTKTGELAGGDLTKGSVTTNPDPFLAQDIVHYGHGAGLGTGGTPRTAAAINWRSNYFTAFGAISPGDSGSGSNTLTGDSVGSERECAGINTHLYVDSSLRTGLGVFAGTRCTLVTATLANGQLVPYPAPVAGAP
jgi:hypothetical protein